MWKNNWEGSTYKYVVTFFIYVYILFLLLPLAQFKIGLVNVTNRIQIRVGPDLIPISYTQLASTCECSEIW